MNTQILEVREDRELGELGLMLETTRMIEYPMVATSGLLVAHDILEHQRGADKIGTIGDELVALGGVWYVRGRWGEISRGSVFSDEENIGADISNMARMYAEGRELHFVPKSESEHDHDEAFDCILECGKRMFLDELVYWEDDAVQRDMQPYWDACLAGLRMGYNMAEDRYEGRCALTRFRDIQEAIDTIIGRQELFEGQRFELNWDEDGARCDELWDEDDPY